MVCSEHKRILCDKNDCIDCYKKSFASHSKVNCWSKKNKLKPRQVLKKSIKKYFFNCDKCSHKFETSVCNILRGSWCPYCCIPLKQLCNKKNCKECYEKSFKSHKKSKYWSNENKINPRQVSKYSHNKYKFNCNKCQHEFLTNVRNISRGRWCSYCCNPPKQLCNKNTCQNCFNKSFASHEKAKYWSDENILKPRQVFKNTAFKYKFNCNKCSHLFEISLDHLSISNRWCPYCCIPSMKLCYNKDCMDCFNRAFSSHEKAKYWSDENKLKPRQVLKNTHTKYKFNCNNCCNVFKSQLYHIANGRWCPICKHKTESIVYEFLKELYNITTQQKFNWTLNKTTNCHRKYDICIEECKLLIEIDGPQHFRQISNWKDPKIAQQIDTEKNKLAIENGYSIIRIIQEDIYYNKLDWKKILINNIYLRYKPAVVLLCTNNEYVDQSYGLAVDT
jgi:very-short-patch-repair endonuclease